MNLSMHSHVQRNANEISNGSGALAPAKRDEAEATIPYFIGIDVQRGNESNI